MCNYLLQLNRDAAKELIETYTSQISNLNPVIEPIPLPRKKTLLIFGVKKDLQNNIIEIRVSEQEYRFVSTSLLNNNNYGINFASESPTVEKYIFSGYVNKRSASTDLAIFYNLKLILNIELKGGNHEQGF